jgi:hypothetical protein
MHLHCPTTKYAYIRRAVHPAPALALLASAVGDAVPAIN